MEWRMIATPQATETPVTDDDQDDGAPLGVDPETTVPIEDSIDLHAFAPRDVRDVVHSYLDAAHEAGFVEVRIIHGRGIGVQREAVRALLARHPLVLAFVDAPPERGGWGATVVALAPKDSSES
jgi:DNA-nicking Smr family endonuclease